MSWLGGRAVARKAKDQGRGGQEEAGSAAGTCRR